VGLETLLQNTGPRPFRALKVSINTLNSAWKRTGSQRRSFRTSGILSRQPLPVTKLCFSLFLSVEFQLSKQYGPVFSIQMGPQKTVVLTGYETVKEALVNQADAFADRPIIPMFQELAQGFGESYLCIGNPFETTTIMNAAVANIIVALLLDKRFDYEDPTYIRLLKLVNENIRLTIKQNRDELFAFINATFIKHLRDLDENDQRSFIDSFLIQQQEVMESFKLEKKKKTNAYFHNENLKAVVANLFGAGVETTSTTLRWGLLLMMKYPEIQSELKVQEEIAKVVGSSQPRIEHRTKMPYTDAVVHEIQRFANIVPTNLPHATATDVTLNGYFIPKGTHIIPLLSSVLHDESQWEKPHKFYPEHFLNSEGKFVKRDAFMPFSAGRRACLGETLAKTELFLFFTSLLQGFTFQPPPGTSQEDLDLTPAVGLTTSPMPHQLCALPRF
uniref:Cytochrome P450 family 2 subfamily W member 1 n=1 Tax=Podarcis muralis TaxID=64176 RepID=A0A670J732_PODMU